MRRFARWAESVIVEWRLEGTCVRRVSRTADVGEMGLFVETAATLERGTRLVLELPAVAGVRELTGRVVRRDGRGVAVALDPGSRVAPRPA